MAELVRKRSSGRQRLRQGYVGKTFTLDGRQYIVEDVIAEGGYAIVLEVKCTAGTNERLALKRVAVNSEQDLYLCRQEIAILKALSDSPNSVTYLASQINKLSREVYEVLILMQLYGGQTGLQLIRQYHGQGKRLPEALILKIFTDVCLAVSRLHHRTKPIIHRDLKIENILQDFSGNFVLCDYGSCTTSVMDPKEVGVGECQDQLQKFTTLAYRAPEMVDLYSGYTISTKSDIWALGCLLYKFCFFDTPFGEQTLAIMRGTFSFPADASNYSNGLLGLIKYTLNTDPNKRPDIFQVSWVAYKLAGKDCPIVNVFNSPIPSVLDMPMQLVKPKATKTLSVSETTDSNSTPTPSPSVMKRTTSQQPTITLTSISSRERPRSRPISSISPASSSSYVSEQKKPPNNMVQSSFKDPLPPPPTDLFGQAPF
ncbi:PREDICTED: AP2-associated protein kinase 1-like [Amphimedon queenslandica]|uniref:non-specific serine/threonine protein kinase n=1 Tax=Amphimedon queenslandica TaxID=400682 RepID=A0AAN0I8H4_AMPQE|nr:PREDICTED: AP2-associated protein kinase 1-like [Amphimedon queenslandica]|eukprot:XP_003382494.1 PREDICTED: AP2-associated protein kinase 1-like [Amphimedon queenslandica]